MCQDNHANTPSARTTHTKQCGSMPSCCLGPTIWVLEQLKFSLDQAMVSQSSIGQFWWGYVIFSCSFLFLHICKFWWVVHSELRFCIRFCEIFWGTIAFTKIIFRLLLLQCLYFYIMLLNVSKLNKNVIITLWILINMQLCFTMRIAHSWWLSYWGISTQQWEIAFQWNRGSLKTPSTSFRKHTVYVTF